MKYCTRSVALWNGTFKFDGRVALKGVTHPAKIFGVYMVSYVDFFGRIILNVGVDEKTRFFPNEFSPIVDLSCGEWALPKAPLYVCAEPEVSLSQRVGGGEVAAAPGGFLTCNLASQDAALALLDLHNSPMCLNKSNQVLAIHKPIPVRPCV